MPKHPWRDGTAHLLTVADGVHARVQMINLPGNGALHFRETAAIVNTGAPPDRAMMVATMPRHGLVSAAPVARPN